MKAQLIVLLSVSTISTAAADVYVKGHYRRDGIYVRPHYRSSPNSTIADNWSYCGNVNPYTGAVGHKHCGTQENNIPPFRSNLVSLPLSEQLGTPQDGQFFGVVLEKCTSSFSPVMSDKLLVLERSSQLVFACHRKNGKLSCRIYQKANRKFLQTLKFVIKVKTGVVDFWKTKSGNSTLIITAPLPMHSGKLGNFTYVHHWIQDVGEHVGIMNTHCHGVWGFL